MRVLNGLKLFILSAIFDRRGYSGRMIELVGRRSIPYVNGSYLTAREWAEQRIARGACSPTNLA